MSREWFSRYHPHPTIAVCTRNARDLVRSRPKKISVCALSGLQSRTRISLGTVRNQALKAPFQFRYTSRSRIRRSSPSLGTIYNHHQACRNTLVSNVLLAYVLILATSKSTM
jgi:hypothetical protein